MELQGTQSSRTNLEMNNKVGDHLLTDFKTYYKATVIKTVVLPWGQTYRPKKQNWEITYKPLHLCSTSFLQGCQDNVNRHEECLWNKEIILKLWRWLYSSLTLLKVIEFHMWSGWIFWFANCISAKVFKIVLIHLFIFVIKLYFNLMFNFYFKKHFNDIVYIHLNNKIYFFFARKREKIIRHIIKAT